MSAIQLPAWIPLVIAAPFVGSFLGLIVARLPESRSVVVGRSVCDQCKHRLAIRDLIPIASWLWLRGRCRYCGGKIAWFHVSAEVLALVLAVWASTVVTGGLLVATCLLGWLLIALALIDHRTLVLPDMLNLLLLTTGLVSTLFFMSWNLTAHVVGAALGLVGFSAVAYGYRRLQGRPGLGYGDAKLLGALGAWVSWSGLPTVILYSAVLALSSAVFTATISGTRLTKETKLPLGPFLALGGWLVWLYGPLTVI